MAPDTPTASPAPATQPKVGLFQDPHFQGLLVQLGGAAIWGASHLALVPPPAQPWVALAGGIAALAGSIFHIKGLMDPASTQTPPAGAQ